MNKPSVKTLRTIAGDRAQELRDLLDGVNKTREYESVRAWESQCYHKPSYIERVLCAANEIISGYGVECLVDSDGQARWEYINMGDTYAATLLYNRETGQFTVGTWGDIVERAPEGTYP
jgi:hypothetical protein